MSKEAKHESAPASPAPEAVDRGEELIEFAGKLHFFAKPWLLRDEYLAWYLNESERLLRAAADRLAALEKYGQHDEDCQYALDPDEGECDCGLDAAFTTLRAQSRDK